MKPLIAVLACLVIAIHLHAQSVVFTNRNGANTAYCGATPGGPGVLNRFSLPEPTHDVISVSDPGTANMPQSSAVSQLDVTTSSSGISISAMGSVERGPLRPFIDFGAAAVAAVNDNWEFVLAAPARFTFTANYSANSLGTTGESGGGFLFGGAGVRPDPGTASDAFGGGWPSSGTFMRQSRGRLLAGRYVLSMNCRADGNNTYPFNGSFNCALALELGPDVPAIIRTQILPQGLEIEWTDPGPKQYTVETSSSLSGNDWAPVSGVTWPISAHTIILPPPASFPAFYRVKLE
jgi:hypothetical protein